MKKDDGLRPNPNLIHLNRSLMRLQFRRLTSELILAQVWDWLILVDLKDTYFHIQIAPHHRLFLRFAFKGVSNQYTILPFELSLAPNIFMKCVDVALSPLR